MRNSLGFALAGLLLLALGDTVTGTAAAATSANDTFTWFGELVSVDAAARTMTVKSPVAYQEALSELKQFKAGDHIWVAAGWPFPKYRSLDSFPAPCPRSVSPV